jgi:hypothetical protein
MWLAKKSYAAISDMFLEAGYGRPTADVGWSWYRAWTQLSKIEEQKAMMSSSGGV